jgi:hypothetical protein
MPSTWVKSTLAGFLCGGSGGIGSITWGGLSAPGTVKSVTQMTIEAEPRLVKFEEAEALRTLHTYGTTGIMVEIELRLAPKVVYDQFIFSHADWGVLTEWANRVARSRAWRKRLVSASEWPLPSYFTPLRKHIRPDESVALIILDREDAAAVSADAGAHGIHVAWHSQMMDPPRPPLVSDFSYNHTTLWAIKSDPAHTYFQAGFAANFAEQCRLVRERFPGEIFQHFEWSSAGAAPDERGRAIGDGVGLGSIPVVRFTTVERLREIMAYCSEVGMSVTNIHTYRMEERGTYPNIGAALNLDSGASVGGQGDHGGRRAGGGAGGRAAGRGSGRGREGVDRRRRSGASSATPTLRPPRVTSTNEHHRQASRRVNTIHTRTEHMEAAIRRMQAALLGLRPQPPVRIEPTAVTDQKQADAHVDEE